MVKFTADDSTPFTFSASSPTFPSSFNGYKPRTTRRAFRGCPRSTSRTSSSPETTAFFSFKEKKPNEPEFSAETAKKSSLISISRVLKGIPHSPHFYPLRNLSDHSRRLLIDGWDRIFEESVDLIQSMRPDDDFWVEAAKLWKTLEELQGMGYCVIAVRRRMIELSDVVLEKGGFKREILGLKNRAELHRMEKSRLEFQILQLKARIEDEKLRFDDAMGKVAKMEDELLEFDDAFGKLVIKQVTKDVI